MSALKYFRKHSIVLLDASTLLDVSKTSESMQSFWNMLLAKRDASEEVKIVVSDGVIKELIRHQQDPGKNSDIQLASKRVLKKMDQLQDDGEIYVVKDHISNHTDTVRLHADRFFINTINNYKTASNIYVITQDVALMQNIYETAGLESLSGRGSKGVYVYKVPRKAGKVVPNRLVRFEDRDDSEDQSTLIGKKNLPPYKPKSSSSK